MNRIRLLSEQVANQIAAGEVIERPASVVKELVENALDAGATRLTVEIQAGGRSLIRVTDDGIGMNRDDALLCLERHATSKIRRAEDLASISTMGFRGEALPSIASVSRFALTTRERDGDSPEGTRVVVTGGKIVEVKAAGAAPGTIIEARQLFFNLPARRKFLRSEETECAHIQHYLTLAALAFPQVAFLFLKDGRQVWHLAGVKTGSGPTAHLDSLRERLRSLYGADQKLLPMEFSAELPSTAGEEVEPDASFEAASPEKPAPQPSRSSFRVWGFLGAPGVSRATRDDQHLFVNRRPVDNRGLNFALLEGYHTALMKGRYPVCCLFLEVDPAAVDVNIHPAKREVRFHRELDVRRLVSRAVRETLLGFASPAQPTPGTPAPEPPSSSGHGSVPVTSAPIPASASQSALFHFPGPGQLPHDQHRNRAEQPAFRLGWASTTASPPQSEAGSIPPNSTEGKPATSAQADSSAALPKPGQNAPPSGGGGSAAQTPTATPSPTPVSTPGQHTTTASNRGDDGTPVPLLRVPLRLVGVIGRLYVLLESDRGLVLLDQHAAHERVLFEQMVAAVEHHEQAPSQKLLLPETVELSARDAQFVREQLDVLTRLGVSLSEFGERTFLLDALPPFVKAENPRQFVLEILDELKSAGQDVKAARLGELTIARTVCRHAVKAHDPLAGRELETLIEDLRHCAMPYTCPHGRPTLIEMNFKELEKRFGRTQ